MNRAEDGGRRAWVVAALIAVGLTVALYGRALGLPFYSDDLLQVRWVRATPILEFWRSVGPYGDYRPLHFSLWKAMQALGLLEPGPVHALNLLAHAVCAALVGALAARGSRHPTASAALATALFAAFPFAPDAVAWASSFSYPLAMALALGAALWVLGRAPESRAGGRGARCAHLPSLILVALAGLAHEGGVVAGPAVALAGLLTSRRHGRALLLYLAASAVPLALILHFSPAGAAYSPGAANWGDNAAVALQAVAYPVSPLAQQAPRVGVSARVGLVAVGLAALLALAGCAALGRGEGGRAVRLFLLGLGWAALWSAIPLLTQPFNWVRDPPRAMYVSAAGAAMMWTAALVNVLPRRWASARGVAWGALALVAVLPAALFVAHITALYARAGDVLWQAIRAASGPGPTLLVNLPGRITPPDRMYPLGHEGVIPMPPPSNADLLVEVHTGRAGAALERSAGAILPRLPYGVELAGPPLATEDIRAARRVFVTAYRADGAMTLEEAGALLLPPEQGAPVARFGDGLALLSVQCRREGSRVTLTATWRLESAVQGTPTVFAHLLGADGRLAAQADGDPLRGLYPLAQWRVGDVLRDVRAFDAAPAGPLTVAFGVWDPAAGVRWPAVDAGGVRLPDDAATFRVAAEPADGGDGHE